jgi:hypothetical protein
MMMEKLDDVWGSGGIWEEKEEESQTGEVWL